MVVICPVCNSAILQSDDRAWMDGWHHRDCLDRYIAEGTRTCEPWCLLGPESSHRECQREPGETLIGTEETCPDNHGSGVRYTLVQGGDDVCTKCGHDGSCGNGGACRKCLDDAHRDSTPTCYYCGRVHENWGCLAQDAIDELRDQLRQLTDAFTDLMPYLSICAHHHRLDHEIEELIEKYNGVLQATKVNP